MSGTTVSVVVVRVKRGVAHGNARTIAPAPYDGKRT
jgi:hypothetical protein